MKEKRKKKEEIRMGLISCTGEVADLGKGGHCIGNLPRDRLIDVFCK